MRDRRRRFLTTAGACAALALAGTALEPLAAPASRATRPAGVAPHHASAGEGLLLASLGGMRTLAADAFWLRGYVMWERRDRAACTTFAKLACALSPETPSFRTGYASWLAFDFPHWSIAEAGGVFKVGEADREKFNRTDALEALTFIDDAMAREPDDARYGLLGGQICDIKLKDRDRAATYYQKASETTAAPWYPTWLYADKLVLTGRVDEARAFMRRYANRVPPGSTRAAHAQRYLADLGPATSP